VRVDWSGGRTVAILHRLKMPRKAAARTKAVQEPERDVGSALGPWTVGSYIGTGAFSTVHACSPTALNSSSKSFDEINGIDWVLKVSKVVQKTGKSKKSKEVTGAQLLFREYNLYRTLKENNKTLKCLPRTPTEVRYNYMNDGSWCFLALERLGKNISQKLAECNHVAPVDVVFNVAVQLVYALKSLHSVGYVFRDVKPDNFMLGRSGRNQNRVYLVDFGAAFKNILYTGKQTKDGCGPAGTPRYMSRNIHEGGPPSPRDDLESLGYMIVLMLTGKLPWDGASSEEETASIKNDTSVANLLKSVVRTDAAAGKALKAYFEAVFSLELESRVDYGDLVSPFLGVLGVRAKDPDAIVEALVSLGLNWGGSKKKEKFKQQSSDDESEQETKNNPTRRKPAGKSKTASRPPPKARSAAPKPSSRSTRASARTARALTRNAKVLKVSSPSDGGETASDKENHGRNGRKVHTVDSSNEDSSSDSSSDEVSSSDEKSESASDVETSPSRRVNNKRYRREESEEERRPVRRSKRLHKSSTAATVMVSELDVGC